MTQPIATPTLSDIMKLIASIKSTPVGSAAMPGSKAFALTGGFDPNSPGGQASVDNLNSQALGDEQSALEAGRGKTFNDLPYDVKQLIVSANDIKAQTGPIHRGFLGTIKHDVADVGGTALKRVSDVLSRGEYTTAGLAKGFEDSGIGSLKQGESPNNPLTYLKAFAHGAKGAGSEGLKGLEGKDKTSWSDVVQNIADINKEMDLNPGTSGDAVVNKAHANKGIAHVNPVLKSGLGLTGDIFLDPTTYLGTGLVGKVGADAGKLADLDKAQSLAKDTERLGVKAKDVTGEIKPVSNTDMAHNLGIDAPYAIRPGKTLTIKRDAFLLPQQISSKLKDMEPQLLAYAKSSAEDSFAQQAKKYEELTPLPENATKAQIARHDNFVRQFAQKNLGMTQAQLEASNLKEITRLTTEGLSPKFSRGLGINLGKRSLGTIPLERLASGIDKAKAGDSAIGKSLNGFDQLLRNSAGVHKELNGVKLRNGAGTRVRALNYLKNKAFQGVGRDDRIRALRNYLHGISDSTPVLNSRGEDVTKYIGDRLDSIQNSVMPEVGDLTSPSEVNRFLPESVKAKTFKSGDEIDPEWLKNHLRELQKSSNKDLHDPAYILGHLNMAHEKALGVKGMMQEIGKTFGHNIKQDVTIAGNKTPLNNRITELLMKDHGYRTATQLKKGALKATDDIPYLGKHVVFSPEDAKGIESLVRHLNDTGGKGTQFERLFDQVQQEWKTLVTRYNPGYHERNLYGETFNSFLAGVVNPNVYRAARKILAGRGKEFLGDADKLTGDAGDIREIRARNALVPNATTLAQGKSGGVAFRRVVSTAQGKTVQEISPDLAWHLYDKNGLKTGFLTEDLSKAVEGGTTKVGRVLHHMDKKMETFTENIEDFARMAHFVDAIKKSPYTDLEEAAKHAADAVRKYHFDYSDFTRTEKQVLTRIFPFYKWTRKNIPLMMEMTLAHPGKVIMPLKGQNAISTLLGYNRGNNTSVPGDYIVPSWLTHDNATPVGNLGGKNTTYIDPPLPWEQAFEAIQSPKQTAGQMFNPYLQVLAQVFAGKTLTGQDVGSANKTFSQQTPLTSEIYNLITAKQQGRSDNTTLAQFLTGLGLMENTPNRMKAQAKQDQTTASSNRKKYQHSQGITRTTNHPGLD